MISRSPCSAIPPLARERDRAYNGIGEATMGVPYKIDLSDSDEHHTRILCATCGKQCSLFPGRQTIRYGGEPTRATVLYQVTCPQCGALKPLISVTA